MRLIFALLLLLGVAAEAAVVTFEDIAPTGPCGISPNPCADSITTAEGFVFSHTGSSTGYRTVYVSSGGPDGNYLQTNFQPEYGAGLRVAHESGQAFDVHSLDTRIPSGPSGAPFDYVFVSGYDQANNLIVSEQFMPLPTGWVTLEFDDSWDSVHSIEISEYFFCGFGGCASLPNAIDNFSASVVPIPAAVWLFASALAALGWLRRRPAV